MLESGGTKDGRARECEVGWRLKDGSVRERGHQECRAWASKLHRQVLSDPKGLQMPGSNLSLYQTEATPLSGLLPPRLLGALEANLQVLR